MFQKCIMGWMDGTARVLVTNYLNFLDRANKIVVFDKQVPVFVGTYDELKQSHIDLARFVSEHNDESDDSTKISDDTTTTTTTPSTSTTPTPTPEQSKKTTSGTVCDSSPLPHHFIHHQILTCS